VELARQHNIPPVVVDMIAQHHGTSLVTYFYHKAVEMGNSVNINEDEYRYNAPKPQSKEAAIIMLADGVEAAVRSMSSPNSGKIEALVRKLIKERLQDGQLDESALTFKDLDLICNAFARILSGIFHTRIEYPENVLEAMKGGIIPNENISGEPAGENSSKPQDGGSNTKGGDGSSPSV
jgi:membrane-associated HD superfamily phosphohydrolase